MNIELLKNPRVITFLQNLAYLPAAWVVGNYGHLWVAYNHSGPMMLFIVYTVALLFLFFGLASPVYLFTKRWQILVGIPLAFGILTIGLPYIHVLKEKADNDPVVNMKPDATNEIAV